MSVEDTIAPVAEVFRLQGEKELEEAEKLYLPQRGADNQAIVLAAARGEELGELDRAQAQGDGRDRAASRCSRTSSTPTTPSGSRTSRSCAATQGGGDLPTCATPTTTSSRPPARSPRCRGPSRPWPATRTRSSPTATCSSRSTSSRCSPRATSAFTIAVDTAWQESVNRRRHADYVECTLPYSREVFGQKVYLARMIHERGQATVHGEWMGFLKVAKGSCAVLRQAVNDVLAEPGGRTAKIPDLSRPRGQRPQGARCLHHRQLARRRQPRRPGARGEVPVIAAAAFRRGGQGARLRPLDRRALLLPQAVHQLRHRLARPALRGAPPTKATPSPSPPAPTSAACAPS